MYYTFKLIKYEGHLRTQGKCTNAENMSCRLVFSTFLHLGIQGSVCVFAVCLQASTQYFVFHHFYRLYATSAVKQSEEKNYKNKKRELGTLAALERPVTVKQPLQS